MSRAKRKRDRGRAALKRLGLDIAPGKRVRLADGFYRLRRGKLVRIPDEWVGKPSELCGFEPFFRRYRLEWRRQSKSNRKIRRRTWWGGRGRVPRDRLAKKRANGRRPGRAARWATRGIARRGT